MVKVHRGHAFCGSLCVPHFLFDEFQQCLGPKAEQFDLLVWMVKRDAWRAQEEPGVVLEPLTWWREAFRAELRARGWAPMRARAVPRVDVRADGMTRVSPKGIVTPCPHSPSCPNSWSCGKKQLLAQVDAL